MLLHWEETAVVLLIGSQMLETSQWYYSNLLNVFIVTQIIFMFIWNLRSCRKNVDTR